ncbi:MAG: methionyl-tRNA formyltransferase [Nitrospirota bacterium]
MLLFLIQNNFKPALIFAIEEEFYISYSKTKVKNYNFANLKNIAEQYHIPYFPVDSVKGKRLIDFANIIKKMNLDLLLVLGWYYMIPRSIRNLTKLGAWGIHASLLPNYSGGAPLVWAIINGEKETGVTLFRMDDGVDDGDIIAQKSFPIYFEDTIREVYQKAIDASKNILFSSLNEFENVTFTPQDKSITRVYPQRKPEDGVINWKNNALSIYNFIRAQTIPYPCAISYFQNIEIKIVDSKIIEINSQDYECGTVVNINNKACVSTKDKFLEIGGIIYEDKRYKFSDFSRTFKLWGGCSRAKNLKMAA